jgi:lauroyl/myristoyl acyltransferase
VNLRSYVHPYSGTRFGRRLLNPVRTSIEDRFLADTVTLRPHASAVALRELHLKLGPGVLATVTANSAGERSLGIPFLGGTMHLALGAATLSRVARVPLLPVFARPSERGTHVIEVHPPLPVEPGIGGRRRDEQLGQAFARELEAFVERYPGVWRGWFNRYQWQPQAPAMPGQGEHRSA